jgi:hypothetical protein
VPDLGDEVRSIGIEQSGDADKVAVALSVGVGGIEDREEKRAGIRAQRFEVGEVARVVGEWSLPLRQQSSAPLKGPATYVGHVIEYLQKLVR